MNIVTAVLGIFVALFGFVLPEGNGDVSNLAAMNFKTNLVIVGSALFVAGVVASSAARIEKALTAKTAHQAMDRAIERHAAEFKI
jgi:hypothetical protein